MERTQRVHQFYLRRVSNSMHGTYDKPQEIASLSKHKQNTVCLLILTRLARH